MRKESDLVSLAYINIALFEDLPEIPSKSAERVLEHYPVEADSHRIETLFVILLAKKAGIGKSRADDSLVAACNDFGITTVDVGDRNKVG